VVEYIQLGVICLARYLSDDNCSRTPPLIIFKYHSTTTEVREAKQHVINSFSRFIDLILEIKHEG
jgi:hypothetical protein